MHANKQLVYREDWSLNKSVTKLLFINSIIIIFKHKMKSKRDTSQHYKTNLLLCILCFCVEFFVIPKAFLNIYSFFQVRFCQIYIT